LDLQGAPRAGANRFAVVVSRFNAEVTDGLLAGALSALDAAGVTADARTIVRVPGAFELPVTAQRLAESGRFDAVVCLGCLIKGDTMHFEYLAEAVSQGLSRVALDSGVPVAFGVLTQLAAFGLIVLMLGAIQKKIFSWHTGFWGEKICGWHYDLMFILMNLVIASTDGGQYVLLK